MRIIVTGGAGFIGSAMCRHLVGSGATILNIDKLTYAANLRSVIPVASMPGYAFLKADIADRSAMDRAFVEFQPDAIVHLAAESHVDRSITGAAPFIATNIVGTFTLLEAARAYWLDLPRQRRGDFRFVHVSTDEVFGSLGPEGHFSESTPYDPSSPYSASKAAADHLVGAWGRTYGLPVIVTNCSNNYGPYQFPEKLIPLMILNALEGRPLPVYGNGLNVRDWLHVEDHVRALELVMRRGTAGSRYTIGGSAERTNLAVVQAIAEIIDELVPGPTSRRQLIAFVTDRPGHDARYAIDAARITSDLGWRPSVTFEQGLRATIDWYLANRRWWEPLRAKVYSGERLGLSGAPQLQPAA